MKRIKQPEKTREYLKRYRAKHREKYLARKAVEAALAWGSLTAQPCARCGSWADLQAHHEDYSRRLDVVWLCRQHHRERHVELAST